MYFNPKLAFLVVAYLIFCNVTKADSFLTAIIANNGHISAN